MVRHFLFAVIGFCRLENGFNWLFTLPLMHKLLACLIRDPFPTHISIRIKTCQIVPSDGIFGLSCIAISSFKCPDDPITFTRYLCALIINHMSELSLGVESLIREVSDWFASNRTSGITDLYRIVPKGLPFEASEFDLPIGFEFSVAMPKDL
jgi:hypothetical protein